ncbi:nucleolar protein 58-like [Sinocyclocheilus grahami]|uniref:nucleolar protein 58-like n=1 Tax=Sinocyclocheilus grahami TaxID=75366 RepID=UPI0007AD1394|nr:PREDICTED: nucleolar protein 58-like [Sinocyclocheilus grahami]
MLVLFETAAGYAIFKVLDEQKLQQVDSLWKEFETPEKANKVVKLKHFEKFQDTTEALAAATAMVEGKLGKSLKKVLKKVVAKEAHEQLAITDVKLGGVIKEKLNLSCVHSPAVAELMRGIRNQMEGLITGLPAREISAMSLGLAHSLSRYKLKFSPDKVDTMIVQAICLLDDLDKELNNYIMRCREWYGWHFPELGKIITDNLAYCKSVRKIGDRTNVASMDLSEILPEEIEAEVKLAAEISMGTEVSEEDIANIMHLCDQVFHIIYGNPNVNCVSLRFTSHLLLPVSDVKVYDPSGDSTLPTVSRKRKIEEVEEGEEEEKPVEAKAKKVKREAPTEGEAETEPPKKKKKKEKKKAEEESKPEEEETAVSPAEETTKKKKKEKKRAAEVEPKEEEEEAAVSPAEETTEKKKKKKRKVKEADD